MTESLVQISMKDENNLNCSYAIVTKDTISVILIWKDLECGIFDYDALKKSSCASYLLLKHYYKSSYAKKDFYKLIGKMCKKHKDSKYFANRIIEDNRIVLDEFNHEHERNEEEKIIFEKKIF